MFFSLLALAVSAIVEGTMPQQVPPSESRANCIRNAWNFRTLNTISKNCTGYPSLKDSSLVTWLLYKIEEFSFRNEGKYTVCDKIWKLFVTTCLSSSFFARLDKLCGSEHNRGRDFDKCQVVTYRKRYQAITFCPSKLLNCKFSFIFVSNFFQHQNKLGWNLN